jgi:hypothetical protein
VPAPRSGCLGSSWFRETGLLFVESGKSIILSTLPTNRQIHQANRIGKTRLFKRDLRTPD